MLIIKSFYNLMHIHLHDFNLQCLKVVVKKLSLELKMVGKAMITCCLIVVHINPLKLQVAVPVVFPTLVYAMFITDYLPELQNQKKTVELDGEVTYLSLTTSSYRRYDHRGHQFDLPPNSECNIYGGFQSSDF